MRGGSQYNILVRTHHRIRRKHHLVSPTHPCHLHHRDTSQTALRDKGDLDREERPSVIPAYTKLERARAFFSRDPGNRPVESVCGGVERPVARSVGDGRVGAGREGYGNGDVAEGDVVVFELVFNVDVARAVVGGGRPAVDCMRKGKGVNDWCERRHRSMFFERGEEKGAYSREGRSSRPGQHSAT